MIFTKYPKYHPLVSDGIEFIPMFRCKDERTAQTAHRFYLTEALPHYYRLCINSGIYGVGDCAYTVHCPYCGAVMQTVAPPLNNHTRALYACEKCNH